jgi:hypothetical protein
MFHSHLLVLGLFSLLVSVFFGTLTRETPRESARIAGVMFASMLGFSLIVGYVMYIFPLG